MKWIYLALILISVSVQAMGSDDKERLGRMIMNKEMIDGDIIAWLNRKEPGVRSELIRGPIKLDDEYYITATPLGWAFIKNRCELAEKLIDEGADITGRIYTKAGFVSILSMAMNCPKVVSKSLDRGANLGVEGPPLMALVIDQFDQNGATDILKKLLEQGFDVNYQYADYFQWTPLLRLAFTGSHIPGLFDKKISAFKILFEYGADPDVKDSKGKTARDYLADGDKPKFDALLPDKRFMKNAPWYTVLGVSEKATPQEIRTAYRALVKTYHPDREKWSGFPVGVTPAEAAERMKLITVAYDKAKEAGKV